VSTKTSPKVLLSPRSGDDDSPFLSMADFFSLLSLTLIYISIAFAPAGELPEDAIPVLLGRKAEPGQTAAANAAYAYIELRSQEDGAALFVRPRGKTQPEILTISLEDPQIELASAWIDRELMRGSKPERVVATVSLRERNADLHRVFNRLVGSIRQDVPVSIVMLSEQE
jgi:hypothetical protein